MSTGGKITLAMLVFAALAVVLCIKVSLGLGITIGVLGIVGAALWGALSGSGPGFDEKAVKLNGTDGAATIKDIRDTGVTLNEMYILVELVVEVEPATGSPYEATVRTTVSRVKLPTIGSRVAVRYDPEAPTHVVLVGDAFTAPAG